MTIVCVYCRKNITSEDKNILEERVRVSTWTGKKEDVGFACFSCLSNFIDSSRGSA
tara:strand:+ start:83 stop:250 length:168 start_codon:yes stop_codon:yes gene_type:complete